MSNLKIAFSRKLIKKLLFSAKQVFSEEQKEDSKVL